MSEVIEEAVRNNANKNLNLQPQVAVVWSNRSEDGIIENLIPQLEKVGFDVIRWKIPDDPFKAAEWVLEQERNDAQLPDLAICPFDRPPVTVVAMFLYHVNVPIAQLHSGDISSGTHDDMDRHCITLWAKWHFCASAKQAARVRKIFRTIGVDPKYVYVSGTLNMDDLSENMMEPPDGAYDIVMYNPPTLSPEKIDSEVTEIINMVDKETYWMEPNGDRGSDFIKKKVNDFSQSNKLIHLMKSIDHASMLGLMSRAKRVIGNSSALYFEAPYFPCQIVPVGDRNRIRETVRPKPGGSKRVAKKLWEWVNE